MKTKSEVSQAIFAEVIAAQSRPFETARGLPIPAMLWVGDGRSFKASNLTFRLVHRYAELFTEGVHSLNTMITSSEISNAVAKAVAQLFDQLGTSGLAGFNPEQIAADLDQRTETILNDQLRALFYYFGCTLLHGENVPDIEIGPVSFETTARWTERMRLEGSLSTTTARRLSRAWSRKRVKPRRSLREEHNERSVLDAVGTSPVICTVSTGKHSSKAASPKALLAGRLAMTSVALLWEMPSRILKDMRLDYDGLFHRKRHAFSMGTSFFGSSSSVIGSPRGHYVGEEWITHWQEFQRLCEPVSEALHLFLDPAWVATRPKVLEALFMSLWWFHEACRDQSDLIAIAKFASSMDSLAAGKRADGIRRLIEFRLGIEPDAPWLNGDRTPQDLIKEIYETTRNQALHGSIRDVGRDWSSGRARAEFVARQCLVASLDWLQDNPDVTDVRRLIKP